MKFTLSWLKDHLETDADAQAVARQAHLHRTRSGDHRGCRRAAEGFHRRPCHLRREASQCRQAEAVHGGYGTASEPVQVVCGAPNAHTGMKAVFAKPGVVIPASGDVLKVGTIRGVESRGMLCSAREMLLGDDHDGIIELPPMPRWANRRRARWASTILSSTCRSRPTAAMPPACTASRAIWRPPISGALKDGSVKPVTGKFPSPEENPSELHAGNGKRLSAVRRAPDPQREERPVAQMGAGPAESGGPAPNFRAGGRHQSHFAGSWAAAACVRRRQALRQHAGAHGRRRASRFWRWTGRPTRSIPPCA